MKSTITRTLSVLTMLIILAQVPAFAQTEKTPMQQRIELMKKNEAKMIYPYVRGSFMTGVLPVNDVTFPIDVNRPAKLVFDFSYGNPGLYSQGLVNPGLEEICRILNLHSAAGIPDKNLQTVIILHGPATMTFLNETAYQERFGKPNANLALIQALQQKGVQLVVCGQTLQLREMDRGKLVPGVKVAFSARSTMSALQRDGYILFPVNTMD